MNAYESENSVFSFARPRITLRKMVKCCLESLCGRAIEAIHGFHQLRKPAGGKQAGIYDSEKRTELSQTAPLLPHVNTMSAANV